MRLVALDARAAGLGLTPGMMLADARALVPELRVIPADPAGDAGVLDRLRRWSGRYSPWTARDGADGLFLDITGCAHLFGGEAALAADIVARLAGFGFAARVGIADTPGAAWAIARCRSEDPVAPAGAAQAALADLPVTALRIDPATHALLDRLGLRLVGDLLRLSPADRTALDPQLARRVDQALGHLPEPISPCEPPPAFHVGLSPAEPIVDGGALGQILDLLLRDLTARLAAIDQGARALALHVFRTDGTTASVAVGTVRPSRDARALARLFADKIATIDPGFGIERVRLDARTIEPLPATQAAFALGARASEHWADGDVIELVDRLANRLDEGAVHGIALRESHVPERAQAPVPAFTTAAQAPPTQPRPLRLFRPEPIETTALLPDDPPAVFRWRRALHRVVSAQGPERIEHEWWCGQREALRDYYRVEDEHGARFWLYRETDTDGAMRWYLHGVFA